MSYSEEFKTVDLILESDAETRGVDAFALSLIKADKQMRKLLTHLVYQFPCFGQSDKVRLRDILENNGQVYFEGLERGFNALYPRSTKELLGVKYEVLRPRLTEAIEHRRKIFHGQLTPKYLTRGDLKNYVDDIREWCELVADSTVTEFKYDGFGRNSFRKSEIHDIWKRFKIQIKDPGEYEAFVRKYLARKPSGGKRNVANSG